MLKVKCDINQQDLKRVDLHFVKSEIFSLNWSCGSRQRDTTSSGWKLKLNNLAVKGLKCWSRLPADKILCPGVDLMLGHRLRRWPKIKSTPGQSLFFAGICPFLTVSFSFKQYYRKEKWSLYCGSGNFRVFRFSQICDFETLHELQNSPINNLDDR